MCLYAVQPLKEHNVLAFKLGLALCKNFLASTVNMWVRACC